MLFFINNAFDVIVGPHPGIIENCLPLHRILCALRTLMDKIFLFSLFLMVNFCFLGENNTFMNKTIISLFISQILLED